MDDDVRREDGLDPWGYPEVPIEEYAPAQLQESNREQRPVCVSCWTELVEDPCRACGRPQNISDVAWYRIVFSMCQRCGHELRPEDEQGCPECGAMQAAA